MSRAGTVAGKKTSGGGAMDQEAAELLLAMNDSPQDMTSSEAVPPPPRPSVSPTDTIHLSSPPSASGGGNVAVSRTLSKCNNFLPALFRMCNNGDGEHSKCITWADDDLSFWVSNIETFARDILPIYYKHNNYASFVRQLNMYGFHRSTEPKGKVEPGVQMVEHFTHDNFKRGREDLLKFIHRKTSKLGGKSDSRSRERAEAVKVEGALDNTRNAAAHMQNTAQIQVLTRDNVQIKQTLGELLGAMQQLQASQSQLKSHSDDLQTENSRQIMLLAQTVHSLNDCNARIESMMMSQQKKKSKKVLHPQSKRPRSASFIHAQHNGYSGGSSSNMTSSGDSSGRESSGSTGGGGTNDWRVDGGGTDSNSGFGHDGTQDYASTSSHDAHSSNSSIGHYDSQAKGAATLVQSSDAVNAVFQYLAEQFPISSVEETDAASPTAQTVATLASQTSGGLSHVVQLLMARALKNNDDASSPLFWAAQYGDVASLETLIIEAALDINARGAAGKRSDSTPLHTTCQQGHLRAAQVLVAFGAEVAAVDGLGRTARDVASSSERSNMVAWFDAVAGMSCLQVAVDARAIRPFEHALRQGLDTPLAVGAEGVPLSPTLLELATTVNSYTGALPVSQEMLAAVKLALQPWSPQTHRIHAPKHRACVRVFLLVMHRLARNHPGANGGMRAVLPKANRKEGGGAAKAKKATLKSPVASAVASGSGLAALPSAVVHLILSFVSRADWA